MESTDGPAPVTCPSWDPGSSQVKPDLSKPQGQTEDMDGSLGQIWSCSAAEAEANQHDTDWTRSSSLKILLFSCRKLGAMSRSDSLLLHTPAAWFLFIALGKLKQLPDLSVFPLLSPFLLSVVQEGRGVRKEKGRGGMGKEEK